VTKRYVIQEHTRADEIHWDLMLEHGDVLKTWRLDVQPELIGHDVVNAVKIFDHDLKFLTYQGAVNKGAGSVCIADEGPFEILEENAVTIHLHFHGRILSGNFILKQIEHDRWQITKI
jgi:hypothetical protein